MRCCQGVSLAPVKLTISWQELLKAAGTNWSQVSRHDLGGSRCLLAKKKQKKHVEQNLSQSGRLICVQTSVG